VFGSFESLFTSGRPRCGQVRDSQLEFLFGSEAAGIGSVALIPLNALSPPGLLALGSLDRERFHPGMSNRVSLPHGRADRGFAHPALKAQSDGR